MSEPKNPNTVILKNQFYPSGLKQIDIWNYYQSVKPQLLKEVGTKNIMIAIMTDVNKPVLKRNFQGKPIYLNHKNYDQIITGRTISLFSEMNIYENFSIIDIDIHPNDGFTWAKKAAIDTYDYVMDKIPIINTAEIRYTGKTSFHIVCKFSRKMKVEASSFIIEKFLRDSPLSKAYTINYKRSQGVPNLDLSPNKYRGTYITLHSLSTIGLRCMNIDYYKVNGFQPRMAKI